MLRKCAKCGCLHGGKNPVCISCIEELEESIDLIERKIRQDENSPEWKMLKEETESKIRRDENNLKKKMLKEEVESQMEYNRRFITVPNY